MTDKALGQRSNMNEDDRQMHQTSSDWTGISPAMQRIIDLLQTRSPMSSGDIALHAFIAKTTLEGGGYLKKMKEMGLIRVQGWLKNHNGFTTPLYALGTGPDCPRPKFRTTDRDSTGMARIVAALRQHGQLSYRVAATLAGLSTSTVKNSGYMDALLEQKRIYIAAWERGGNGHLSPLYAAGAGENQKKPPALSRHDIMQRHRQRLKVLRTGAASVKQQLQALQRNHPARRPEGCLGTK